MLPPSEESLVEPSQRSHFLHPAGSPPVPGLHVVMSEGDSGEMQSGTGSGSLDRAKTVAYSQASKEISEQQAFLREMKFDFSVRLKETKSLAEALRSKLANEEKSMPGILEIVQASAPAGEVSLPPGAVLAKSVMTEASEDFEKGIQKLREIQSLADAFEAKIVAARKEQMAYLAASDEAACAACQERSVGIMASLPGMRKELEARWRKLVDAVEVGVRKNSLVEVFSSQFEGSKSHFLKHLREMSEGLQKRKSRLEGLLAVDAEGEGEASDKKPSWSTRKIQAELVRTEIEIAEKLRRQTGLAGLTLDSLRQGAFELVMTEVTSSASSVSPEEESEVAVAVGGDAADADSGQVDSGGDSERAAQWEAFYAAQAGAGTSEGLWTPEGYYYVDGQYYSVSPEGDYTPIPPPAQPARSSAAPAAPTSVSEPTADQKDPAPADSDASASAEKVTPPAAGMDRMEALTAKLGRLEDTEMELIAMLQSCEPSEEEELSLRLEGVYEEKDLVCFEMDALASVASPVVPAVSVSGSSGGDVAVVPCDTRVLDYDGRVGGGKEQLPADADVLTRLEYTIQNTKELMKCFSEDVVRIRSGYRDHVIGRIRSLRAILDVERSRRLKEFAKQHSLLEELGNSLKATEGEIQRHIGKRTLLLRELPDVEDCSAALLELQKSAEGCSEEFGRLREQTALFCLTEDPAEFEEVKKSRSELFEKFSASCAEVREKLASFQTKEAEMIARSKRLEEQMKKMRSLQVSLAQQDRSLSETETRLAFVVGDLEQQLEKFASLYTEPEKADLKAQLVQAQAELQGALDLKAKNEEHGKTLQKLRLSSLRHLLVEEAVREQLELQISEGLSSLPAPPAASADTPTVPKAEVILADDIVGTSLVDVDGQLKLESEIKLSVEEAADWVVEVPPTETDLHLNELSLTLLAKRKELEVCLVDKEHALTFLREKGAVGGVQAAELASLERQTVVIRETLQALADIEKNCDALGENRSAEESSRVERFAALAAQTESISRSVDDSLRSEEALLVAQREQDSRAQELLGSSQKRAVLDDHLFRYLVQLHGGRSAAFMSKTLECYKTAEYQRISEEQQSRQAAARLAEDQRGGAETVPQDSQADPALEAKEPGLVPSPPPAAAVAVAPAASSEASVEETPEVQEEPVEVAKPKAVRELPELGQGARGSFLVGGHVVDAEEKGHTVELKAFQTLDLLNKQFMVTKFDPKKRMLSRKARLYEVDFFQQKFKNMTRKGKIQKTMLPVDLVSVGRYPNHSRALKLQFKSARHAYEIICKNNLERETLHALCMAMRPSVETWCPPLVPEGQVEQFVTVAGTYLKPKAYKEGKGVRKIPTIGGQFRLFATRAPQEQLLVWSGTCNLEKNPRVEGALLRDIVPADENHDIYAIALQQVPYKKLEEVENLANDIFRSKYVLVAASLANDVAVLVVVNSHHELKVSGTSSHAVCYKRSKMRGCAAVSFCFNETSFMFLSSHFEETKRLDNFYEIVMGLKPGVKSLDFYPQYDYVFWMGDTESSLSASATAALADPVDDYGPIVAEDSLNKQVAQEKIFYDFVEQPIAFAPNYRRGVDHTAYRGRIFHRGLHPNSIEAVSYGTCDEAERVSDHHPTFSLVRLRTVLVYNPLLEGTSTPFSLSFRSLKVVDRRDLQPIAKGTLAFYSKSLDGVVLSHPCPGKPTATPAWNASLIPTITPAVFNLEQLKFSSLMIAVREGKKDDFASTVGAAAFHFRELVEMAVAAGSERSQLDIRLPLFSRGCVVGFLEGHSTLVIELDQ